MSRDSQAESTRAAVIEAARELWAEHGFFAVSTTDIVERAGVGTRGALYHHFKNREDLFIAVFGVVQARLMVELAPVMTTESDPLARLAASLNAFIDITSRSSDVQALLVDGPALFGSKRWQELEQQRGLALIEGQLSAAVTSGVMDDQPIRPLAQLLLILVDGAALSVAADSRPERARALTGTALATIVNGLRTAG